jgi:hypothetical protein
MLAFSGEKKQKQLTSNDVQPGSAVAVHIIVSYLAKLPILSDTRSNDIEIAGFCTSAVKATEKRGGALGRSMHSV